MLVRPATREDLPDIARVAEAAEWASYGDLLSELAVAEVLQRDFSPGALGRRLLAGGMRVASLDDVVAGAASGTVADGVIHVDVLVTEPRHRRRGIATALLTAMRGLAPSLPVCADVLLGNHCGEGFLEAAGFVPGEVLHATIAGETLVERRWWMSGAWRAAG